MVRGKVARDYFMRMMSSLSYGLIGVWVVCTISYSLGGELPDKESIMIAMASMYVVGVSYFSEWEGLPSIERAMFTLAYGSGGAVMSFTEFQAGASVVVVYMIGPTPIVLSFACHIMIGTAWRLFRD